MQKLNTNYILFFCFVCKPFGPFVNRRCSIGEYVLTAYRFFIHGLFIFRNRNYSGNDFCNAQQTLFNWHSFHIHGIHSSQLLTNCWPITNYVNYLANYTSSETLKWSAYRERKLHFDCLVWHFTIDICIPIADC